MAEKPSFGGVGKICDDEVKHRQMWWQRAYLYAIARTTILVRPLRAVQSYDTSVHVFKHVPFPVIDSNDSKVGNPSKKIYSVKFVSIEVP